MRIWIVAISEPIPEGSGRAERPHPAGAFAEYLARKGHEVVWWTSTFDHFRKEQRFPADTIVQAGPKFRIQLLHGSGYKRNLSLARLADHASIARKFARESLNQPKPDVIVADLPPIELPAACVRYGSEQGVPVLLALRDMWPDIFVESVPKPMRWAARLALAPLFRQARFAHTNAAGILGITEEFVEWGVKKAGRIRSGWDRVFPLVCSSEPPDARELAEADAFWDAQGVHKEALSACYIGALGQQFDIAHIIAGACLLREHGICPHFVICGNGEKRALYQRMAVGLKNVLFPGRITWPQAYSLMRRCKVGLDPLPNRYDFLASINKKAVDYLSAGLPVLSSPASGVLSDFLRIHACGASYKSDDGAAFARAMDNLLRRPDVLQLMSLNARAAFLREFDSEAVHAQVLQHLDKLTRALRDASTVVEHENAVACSVRSLPPDTKC